MQKLVVNTDPVITEIIESVAYCCNTTPDYILGCCRKRYLSSFPRMLCFLFAKAFTNYKLAEIGYMVGNRDHATVLHGLKTVSTLVFLGDMAVCKMFDVCRVKLTAGDLPRIKQLEETLTKLRIQHGNY
jgi:hypothetical protein